MTITKHTDYSNLFEGCVFYADGTSLTVDKMGNALSYWMHGPPLCAGRFGPDNHAFNFRPDIFDVMVCDVAFRTSEMTFLVWYNYNASQPSSYSAILTTNYTGAAKTNSAAVFLWDSGGSNIGYSVHRDDTTNVKRIQANHSGPGVWNCVVCGHDASNVVIISNNGGYSSGGFDWTNTYPCDSQLTIGSIYGDMTQYQMYTGMIGEIMIWNRLLSESEMKELYRVMSAKYIYPTLTQIKNVE